MCPYLHELEQAARLPNLHARGSRVLDGPRQRRRAHALPASMFVRSYAQSGAVSVATTLWQPRLQAVWHTPYRDTISSMFPRDSAPHTRT